MMSTQAEINEESEISRLIAAQQAHPEKTMREIAEPCGLPSMRARCLLIAAEADLAQRPDAKMLAAEKQTGKATLGDEFHAALCDLLSQGQRFRRPSTMSCKSYPATTKSAASHLAAA